MGGGGGGGEMKTERKPKLLIPKNIKSLGRWGGGGGGGEQQQTQIKKCNQKGRKLCKHCGVGVGVEEGVQKEKGGRWGR